MMFGWMNGVMTVLLGIVGVIVVGVAVVVESTGVEVVAVVVVEEEPLGADTAAEVR